MRAALVSVAAVVAFVALTFSPAYGGITLYPANNGFELPNLTGNGGGQGNAYGYANQLGGEGPLTIPGWTFTGGSGVAANGSAFGVSGAVNGNHDGTMSTYGQAGLLQGGDGTLTGTSISQSVGGFVAGVAVINFSAENRACCSGGSETLNVFLNGALIDTVVAPSGSFQDYSTLAVPVSAGANTIAFAGRTSGGDQTVFIDTVSITNTPSPTPEPASVVVWSVACAAGLFVIRRRRKA